MKSEMNLLLLKSTDLPIVHLYLLCYSERVLDFHFADFDWTDANRMHSCDDEALNYMLDWFSIASHLFPDAEVVFRMFGKSDFSPLLLALLLCGWAKGRNLLKMQLIRQTFSQKNHFHGLSIKHNLCLHRDARNELYS